MTAYHSTNARQWSEVLKSRVKLALSPGQLRMVRHVYIRLLSTLHQADLTKLAIIHGTDKWNDHWYTQHYQTRFQPLRHRKLNILEIGVGGGADPVGGGGSLRMWKYFFPNSNIHGIDIYDKSAHEEERIRTFRGSQADRDFLLDVFRQIGSLDIIIDDGSHMNEHMKMTFTTLFPLLNDGGIYAIEDTDSSYNIDCGGDNNDLHNSHTVMNFFKDLTDGLNYEALRILGSTYEASDVEKNIMSIQFYYNLIILQKGREPHQYFDRIAPVPISHSAAAPSAPPAGV